MVRAITESSAARMTVPGLMSTMGPMLAGSTTGSLDGITWRRMVSTSSTCARRSLLSPSRRARLVTIPPAALPSADSTWRQSRRTMSSTDSTAKAWVLRAYSVISRMFSPVFGVHPATAGKSMTGMIWPRRSTTPIMWGCAPAMAVMVGIGMISRILNTLIPNSSLRSRFASSPRRNSSSSSLLELVRLVLSSISCWIVCMAESP